MKSGQSLGNSFLKEIFYLMVIIFSNLSQKSSSVQYDLKELLCVLNLRVSFLLKKSQILTVMNIPGEWKLVDKCLGLALVNKFNIKEVYKSFIHWGTGTVNLELWSEQRPVSKQTPIRISHSYEVIQIP